ncbi:MAG TPA: fatty acid desaturase [Blastocatellia bacterium]|nr:fatty acid desaturase [Blastocatellia bacterium]
MATSVLVNAKRGRWDGLLVSLSLAHGWLLVGRPSAIVIALGLWWNANTISHNFIHRPFFGSRAMNTGFSLYLSLLLGFPQSFWRKRHLAHHGIHRKLKMRRLDFAGVIALWVSLLVSAPDYTLAVYLPGFLLGLALCFLQGHYEHAHGTTSHYGSLYNLLLFNDGYHAEHHLHPGVHWSELPARKIGESKTSRWPPVLRWLDCLNLCGLERLVLRSSLLRRLVVDKHERALRRLSIDTQCVETVGIVGGGLFPRSAIILRRLLPSARLTIVDMNAGNIAVARAFIDNEIECVTERFNPDARCPYDLLVIPLAFVGRRESIYRDPPSRLVLVHDWIWRRRGHSAIVSWLLLKRINLVKQ